MQDEHPLLADLGQPVSEPGEPLRGVLVGDEAPGMVEQSGVDELGDRVDEARPAHADRLDVSDHLEVEPVGVDRDALDGSVGGSHAAFDLGRLERRAGGGGRREHAVDGPQRDLAVGADVDEQPQPPVARQAGGEHAGDDVAPDVGAQRREHVRRRPRVHVDAEVGGPRGRELVRRHGERRHRERLGIDPERDLHHRDVAAHRDLVDLARRHVGVGEDLGGQLGHRLVGAGLQRPEGLIVHHRRRDAGDHVGAEGLLAVEHRAHGRRLAALEIEQRRHHRRGPEIEGDGKAPGGRVPGLDIDQLVVDHDRGDVEVRAAQGAAQRSQRLDRRMGLEVVECVADALQVGALVLHRRLLEHQVTLLHGRAQDDVAPDADQRRLGPGLERGHLDDEVAAGVGPARQPPAFAELVGGERAGVDAGEGHVAGDDPHLALLAGPVAAAGRVDGDPVPAGGVEDRRSARDADLGAVGQEAQADALRAVGLDDRLLALRARVAWGPRRSCERSRPPARRPCGRGGRRSSSSPRRRGRAAGRRRAPSPRTPRRWT